MKATASAAGSKVAIASSTSSRLAMPRVREARRGGADEFMAEA